ncbi:MAG TPA: lysophospholipid acyltransferase family protein [Syntrophorhabdaceae bacterium]|nr:lysophospholipid acyltransferase family protein [Syntrophorhabdaceae bacterium]
MHSEGLVITNKMFQISMGPQNPSVQRVISLFRGSIEKTLLISKLNDIYSRVAEYKNPKDFAEKTLDCLNITWKIDNGECDSIPSEGPLVVVCNHPFGVIESLVLASLLLKVRPDSKIMANYLLGRIPQLSSIFFCVDPLEGPAAARQNAGSLKNAISWLQEGHVLATFPAGQVSSLNLQRLQIADPKWSTITGRIIRKTCASVLPIYFEGCNSAAFHAAGLIHPHLRTALLPHELLKKQNSTVKIRTGTPIPFQKVSKIICDDELTEYLRMRTYLCTPLPKE